MTKTIGSMTLSIIFGAVMLVAGCAKASAAPTVVGEWVGSYSMNDETVAEKGAGVTFGADGSFSHLHTIDGQNSDGTWHFSDLKGKYVLDGPQLLLKIDGGVKMVTTVNLIGKDDMTISWVNTNPASGHSNVYLMTLTRK